MSGEHRSPAPVTGEPLEFIGDDYELTFTPTRSEQGERQLTIRCPRGVVLDRDDVLAVLSYCDAWLKAEA